MILVWTVVAAHLLMILALYFSKVTVDLTSMGQSYILIGFLVVPQLFAYWRQYHRLCVLFDTLLAGFLLTIPAIVFSYVAMGTGLPLADRELMTLDATLGFDWYAFISYVDQRPMLSYGLALAYSSFFYQLTLLPVYFALVGMPARSSAIVFGYVVILLICAVVSIWYPALGTYVVYGVGLDDLSNIYARFGFHFLEQFHAVREQSEFVLNFHQPVGMITFPSGHAAMAGLCAWAAWGSRLLRYPLLLLNIAMATSAISHANHYLVDVIAGLGIAGLAISLATALFFRRSVVQSAAVQPVALNSPLVSQ